MKKRILSTLLVVMLMAQMVVPMGVTAAGVSNNGIANVGVVVTDGSGVVTFKIVEGGNAPDWITYIVVDKEYDTNDGEYSGAGFPGASGDLPDLISGSTEIKENVYAAAWQSGDINDTDKTLTVNFTVPSDKYNKELLVLSRNSTVPGITLVGEIKVDASGNYTTPVDYALSSDTADHTFAALTYKEVPTGKDIVITNSGIQDLSALTYTSSNADFVIGGTQPASLTAGASTTITVTPKTELAASATTYQANITVADSTNAAATVTIPVKVTVGKATPKVATDPTVTATAVYAGTARGALTAGTAQDPTDGTTVAGSWAWTTGDNTVKISSAGDQNWTFTPNDTTNYVKATGNIAFTIKNAESTAITAFNPTTGVHTGSNLLPTVEVKTGQTALTANTEYTLAWHTGTAAGAVVTEGIKVGTYVAVVTIKSAYVGQYTAPTNATFTVTQATLAKLAAPSVTVNSATQITVTTVTAPTGATKVQYSSDDGVTWQDSNVFTGLTPDTAYQFKVKAIGDGNHTDSSASNATSGTTLNTPTYGITLTTTPTFANIAYGAAQPVAQNIAFTNEGNQVQDLEFVVAGANATSFTVGSEIQSSVAAGATANVSVQPKNNLDAGTYTVTVQAKSANNATGVTATVTLTVEPKQLTWAANDVAATKVYNNSLTNAALTGAPTVAGMKSGETITAAIKANQKVALAGGVGVATNRTYTVTNAMTTFTYGNGAKAANYILPIDLAMANGEITAATITGVGAITGTVAVGSTLTLGAATANNALTPANPADYTIQWYTADGTIGTNEATIASATGTTLVLADAQIGKIVYAKVTGTGNYTGTATSAATTVVPKKAVTGEPAISITTDGGTVGTAEASDVLTVAKGTMNADLSEFDIQWKRGDVAIAGATNTTYTIVADDMDKAITAVVTAKSTSDFDGTATSNVLTPGKAVITGVPTITGTTALGDTLTAEKGTMNAELTDVTLQWLRGGVAITGATGTTYVIVKADLNKDITVKATAIAGGTYTGEATSVATAIPAVAPDAITVASASGDGKLTINWAAPFDGGSALTQYTVKVTFIDKTNGDAVTDVTNSPFTVLAPAVTHDVASLTNGVEYTITLSATNAAGTSTDYVIKATPQAVPSGGGGGGVTTYTVKFDAGKNGTISGATSQQVESGKMIKTAPEVKAKEGFTFTGWSVDGKTVVDPTTVKITKATTFTALYRGANDHMAYIKGIDGAFAPLNDMSRAEAIAMLARLSEGYDGKPRDNKFSDINANDWSYNEVTFAASVGMTKGFLDGTFKPDQAITRAEFATMIARFMGIEKSTNPPKFADTVGTWAEGHIQAMVEKGVVDGRDDGTFAPDMTITRAEAVKMINVAIGRTPSNEQIDANMEGYANPFSDMNDTSYWAFYHIMESAIDHIKGDFHTVK